MAHRHDYALRAAGVGPRTLAIGALLALAACGGGGGYGGNGGNGGGSGWTEGVFLPSGTYRAQCVAPRTGTNPATGQPYPDVAGTRLDENNFLRSYSNETYLWYDEIVDRDPALYQTPEYFDLLKTDATTASGNPKDRFHFSIDTDEWFDLSTSGTAAGYGAQFAILSATEPREVTVAFVDPGTPAAAAGLGRGDDVVAVDGVPVVDGSPDALNAGLFPAEAGETHTLTLRDRDTRAVSDVQLTSDIITSTPVQNVRVLDTGAGPVGYLLFNDHIGTAERGLYDAITTLDAAGVNELVVDIRYNGGGFLAIASQLAYMVAGTVPTAGRTFETLKFNDKHPTTDPVTGQRIEPMPFFSETLGFSSLPAGTALPALDLNRVFVLTGPGTCSAAESFMNSLRGVGVEVILVGSTTCGKPYGFYPTDNCGVTYFTIQFQGVNDAGFGDYSDGFSPASDPAAAGTPVTGCAVADDFGHDLGDPLEARLAEAISYAETGACTPAAAALVLDSAREAPSAAATETLRVPKSPWRSNRILGEPRR